MKTGSDFVSGPGRIIPCPSGCDYIVVAIADENADSSEYDGISSDTMISIIADGNDRDCPRCGAVISIPTIEEFDIERIEDSRKRQARRAITQMMDKLKSGWGDDKN